MKKSIKNILIASIALGMILGSCQKEEEDALPIDPNTEQQTTSKLRILLTDAPGDYKAVYIDIEGVEIFSSDSTSGGWKSLDSVNTGIFDLIKLSNGLDTVLGSSILPPGKINQIRLILGNDNSVVLKNGDSIHMRTPSAQQSGLKLKINDSLVAGITYNIILDFDACKSVVKSGNSGRYNLKPVIRAITNANSGAIKGIVLPDSVSTAAIAVIGPDSLGTFTDNKGEFLIRGLQPGTYDVYLNPGSASGYSDTTISSVVVINGAVSDIGPIQL